MDPATNTITIKNCAKGAWCDEKGTKKCVASAKHGDDCSTGNTGCNQDKWATDKLMCQSGKCHYSGTVGDGCTDDADCMQGGAASTCTASICTGAVDADGDCDATAAKACKKGLNCWSGKCKAYLAADATCTVDNGQDNCAGGLVCSGATGAMKCVLTGSQAVGTETNNGAACMGAMYDGNNNAWIGYDSTTKKCVAAERSGATVATGGVCAKSSECKSAMESCGSCTGGGKGVCRMPKTDGIYATDMAAYAKCQSTSGCSKWSSSQNSMSCLVKACGKTRQSCASMTVLWDLNGGTAPTAANLDMMASERPECTAGAATTTVSVMALLGAVAVALRLA